MATPSVSLQQVVIQGLLQRLEAAFSCTAYLLTTTDRYNLARVIQQLKTENVTFPLMFVTPNTFGVNSNSYNPRSLSRSGVYTSVNDGTKTINRIPILPVEMQFTVVYLTTDFYGLLDFSSRWMMGGMKDAFNLTVTYDGADFDIKSQVDPTLSVPQKDNSSELAGVYEISANLSVNGYFSAPTEYIGQVPIVQTTNLNAYTVLPGTPGKTPDFSKTYT